jgi:hypothetical protein
MQEDIYFNASTLVSILTIYIYIHTHTLPFFHDKMHVILLSDSENVSFF